ncbi:MAG: pentapeptide repeat-containing protein, partial [Desulfobacterales bacterium]|nr:pentapeptide repeat-containing protein [Desulfobacterales bacterium]
WAKESEKILGGEEFGRRTIVLSPPKFEVLYLEPFSDDQIREVITRRLGAEDGPAVAERILETENLAEMARKPVLIELLLAALAEVSAAVLENPAQVYLYATNRLLLRNIDTKRTFTTTADKLYFLCELAWEMIQSGELRIHYTDIPERIEAYFGDRIKAPHELDTWDYDLRAQTLLHRDAAGYYEFAHKSLAEYFVAFKFAAELGCLAPAFTQTYCEADGQPCQVPIEQKDIAGLAETFGAMALTDARVYAVRGLLLGLMVEGATNRLWEVIDETKGKTLEQVKFSGGNAATLLRLKGESFEGGALAHTVLASADLYGIDLTGAALQGAWLREADLQGAVLSKVNLRDCTLENANLHGADLTEVSGVEDIGVASLLWSKFKNYLVAGAEDGSVRIWETETWQETVVTSRFSSEVRSVVTTQDGKHLIYGDSEGDTAILFDLSEAKEVQRLKNERYGGFFQMALSPDDGFLVYVENEGGVIALDLQSGQERKISREDETDLDDFCVCFGPDGKKLISGGHGKITIWDFKNCQEILILNSTNSPVYQVFHSKYENRLLAAGFENIELWDSETGECIFSLGYGCESVCYSHKEDRFAGGNVGVIQLFNSESGSLIHTIQFDGATDEIAFSPNDRYLASGGYDAIRIWDVDPDSPTFGKCLKVLDVKMDCQGMQISGAHGLEQEMEWRVEGQKRKGTLLEFFAERGAVLDEEQE